MVGYEFEGVEYGKPRDMQACFRDPHNPWQRGIDENTNGLLHQCFPERHRPVLMQPVLPRCGGRLTR